MQHEVVLDPTRQPGEPGVRDRNDKRVPEAAEFADLGATVVEIVEDGEALKISFDRDLTPEESQAVLRRALLTADEVSIEGKARQAVGQINTYLKITSPTAAQSTAQIKLLSRAVKQLILLVVPDATDAEPGV